jgi:hypothetical protein
MYLHIRVSKFRRKEGEEGRGRGRGRGKRVVNLLARKCICNVHQS